MTCAHIDSTDRHTLSIIGGSAGRRARYERARVGQTMDGRRTRGYVSLLSARAPVSYQFRMREPWYKPPSPYARVDLRTTGGRRRRRRLNLVALDLVLPSLPVSKYVGPETGGTVGALGGRKGGTALPLLQRTAFAFASPNPLTRPSSRTLGFNSSSRPAPSHLFRWQTLVRRC